MQKYLLPDSIRLYSSTLCSWNYLGIRVSVWYVLCPTLLLSPAQGTGSEGGPRLQEDLKCMNSGHSLQIYSVKYFHQGLVRR